MQNRFEKFSPQERTILRVLIQNHCNSVSEIALHSPNEPKICLYLAELEELETEIEEVDILKIHKKPKNGKV